VGQSLRAALIILRDICIALRVALVKYIRAIRERWLRSKAAEYAGGFTFMKLDNWVRFSWDLTSSSADCELPEHYEIAPACEKTSRAAQSHLALDRARRYLEPGDARGYADD
jgi:hypothetical protein